VTVTRSAMLSIPMYASADISGDSITSAIQLINTVRFSSSSTGVTETPGIQMTQIVRSVIDITGGSSTPGILVEILRLLAGSPVGVSETRTMDLTVYEFLFILPTYGTEAEFITDYKAEVVSPEYTAEFIINLEARKVA
jgi:hypothetical protein